MLKIISTIFVLGTVPFFIAKAAGSSIPWEFLFGPLLLGIGGLIVFGFIGIIIVGLLS